MFGTIHERYDEWKAARRERKTEKLTAKAARLRFNSVTSQTDRIHAFISGETAYREAT